MHLCVTNLVATGPNGRQITTTRKVRGTGGVGVGGWGRAALGWDEKRRASYWCVKFPGSGDGQSETSTTGTEIEMHIRKGDLLPS